VQKFGLTLSRIGNVAMDCSTYTKLGTICVHDRKRISVNPPSSLHTSIPQTALEREKPIGTPGVYCEIIPGVPVLQCGQLILTVPRRPR
jgi:hypothetical protein